MTGSPPLARRLPFRLSLGWRDLALVVVLSVLWGISTPVSKIGVNEMPPLFMLAVRFFIVALAVFFYPVSRVQMKSLFRLSLTLAALHFPCMFIGLRYVDASAAAVLTQLQLPFAALLAAFVFGERLSVRAISGIALAFAGVVVIAGTPNIFAAGWTGLVLMIAAAFFWAVASLQMKSLGRISPFAANAWLAVFAGPLLLAESWIFEQSPLTSFSGLTLTGAGAILYLVVMTTFVGYGIWFKLVQAHPVSVVMPFTLTNPMFGILSSALMLGEQITLQFMAGAALTLCGLALIVVAPAKLVQAADGSERTA
jgi:O-acetylserine/cysteine efflux transporter